LEGIQEFRLGEERAVIVPLEAWEKLLEMLEDLEDAMLIDKVLADPDEEFVEHDEVCRSLGLSPLRYLRKQRAMTQGELAHKAGLSQSFIARVETNDKRLSAASRRKIAKALGVAEDKLVY
jgi:DNA-binding XRE family transcriptional regulator